MTNKLYIITGTPGTGKTTLIQSLREAGINCVEEPARVILHEQLKIDGPDLPSKDPKRFVQAMARKQEKEFDELSKGGNLTFFDRGIPDNIAYALRFGVEPEEFREASQKRRYNSKVFILPPWKDIFVNDDLRRLSFEESLLFHKALTDAYLEQKYDLTELPRCSIEKRIEIILEATREP